jgi:hypothetical protein
VSSSLSGSALRFSQPLSGFLAHPSLRPCFVPLPFLGSLPSEVFPRRNCAPLSGPLLPCRYPLASWNVLPRSFTSGFTDAHALRRSCLDPPLTMHNLSTCPKTRFPVVLDREQQNRSTPRASPTSKPCSSCESVLAEPGCPETAPDPLLESCPSRAFASHASDPRTRSNPRARTRASRHATRGTSRPPRPGETTPTRMHRGDLVDGLIPGGTSPDRLATALLLP